MKKIPCPICRKFNVLKRSKLTNDYWCKKCSKAVFSLNDIYYIKSELMRSTFNKVINKLINLKKVNNEIIKWQKH